MDRILELILVLAIIGASLAFGGVQPITYTLVEAVLFLALTILLFSQTRKGRIRLPAPLWPFLFGFWVLLQVIPLPVQVISVLSPARDVDSKLESLLAVQQSFDTLSVNAHDTGIALMKFLAYLSGFLLAAYLFDSGKRKSLLIRCLILLGVFEAAYGIVQYTTGWQKIFTYSKIFDLGEATGTYINHNHFAGFLELTLPFVAAMVFYSFQLWLERRRTSGKRDPRREASSKGLQAIAYLFLLVIMVVALIFSHSRGGILATVFSLAFLAILGQLKIGRRLWLLGALLFAMCVVGYGLWIGLNPVLARFEAIGKPGLLRMESRVGFWSDEIRLVRDHPVIGTGLGTFGSTFRQYQSSMVDSYVDHAHNDYLEFSAETGLVGGALLFLPIFYLLGRMVISFLDDPRRYRRAVTLGCIGSTLALLIHSVVDFNLQIPANALVFAAVLGIGYKATIVERSAEEPSTPILAESPPWK